MATKGATRVLPRLDEATLRAYDAEQLESGLVHDVRIAEVALGPLVSARGQGTRMERCLWQAVSAPDGKADRLILRDVRAERCDLANLDLRECSLERVEWAETRFTGGNFSEGQLKSVLFDRCNLSFASFRMARLQLCVFDHCNLADADMYDADLRGAVFRNCDLSRMDVSRAKMDNADVRGCRLDGLRGMPAQMAGLTIDADQAAQLITLFGVRVIW